MCARLEKADEKPSRQTPKRNCGVAKSLNRRALRHKYQTVPNISPRHPFILSINPTHSHQSPSSPSPSQHLRASRCHHEPPSSSSYARPVLLPLSASSQRFVPHPSTSDVPSSRPSCFPLPRLPFAPSALRQLRKRAYPRNPRTQLPLQNQPSPPPPQRT
jgi:hypothetical protein